MSRVELVSIGHLSHDIIVVSGRIYKCLGGSVAYVSAVSSVLNFKPGIVSKVGDDFKKNYLSFLKKLNINLIGLKKTVGKTTCFKNIYLNDERIQVLLELCRKIYLKDIPEEYFEAKVFHCGPIFREVSYSVIREAYRRGIPVALDVQGYCRRKGSNSVVENVNWGSSKKILKFVEIFKSTLTEASLITQCRKVDQICKVVNKLGPKIILITLGSKGSFLSFEGSIFSIPAAKAKVSDPTGAGDVFLAAFLVNYFKRGKPIESSVFASAAASIVVEDIGLRKIPTYKEIESKMSSENLMDKVRQL